MSGCRVSPNYDLENRSLFDSLRSRYQIAVTGGTQQLFAIRADKRLQEYLGVRAGHPILQLNRKIETNPGPGFTYLQSGLSARRRATG